MTPEERKAHQLLNWMLTNPPIIKGETPELVKRRRKVLRSFLSRVTVNADGCFMYGTGSRDPVIHWPVLRTRVVEKNLPNQYTERTYYNRRTRGLHAVRVLFTVYFPRVKLTKTLIPTCPGKLRCVNPQHRMSRAAMMSGSHNLARTKLSTEQVRQIFLLRQQGRTTHELAAKYGVGVECIRRIGNGSARALETADLRKESS